MRAKGLLHMEVFRLWRSKGLWIAIAGIAASGMGLYSVGHGPDVIGSVISMLGVRRLDLAAVLFAAIPFAGGFCEEWKSGFSVYARERGGTESYLASLFLTMCLSVLVTVMAGMLLLSLLLSCFKVLCCEQILENYGMDEPYGVLLRTGHFWAYLLCRAYLLAVAAIPCVGLGMTVSVKIPDRFVAVALAPAVKYALGWLTLGWPGALSINRVINAYPLWDAGIAVHLLRITAETAAVLIILYLLFRRMALKRLRYEMV